VAGTEGATRVTCLGSEPGTLGNSVSTTSPNPEVEAWRGLYREGRASSNPDLAPGPGGHKGLVFLLEFKN
jgi:hypothetical protein